MTTQAIQESDMTFGPYPEGACFYIEKSSSYKRIQEGVQMAEFLLLRTKGSEPVIWIVEAKSSSPRQDTQPNFMAYIDEIRSKFTNAFLLGMASKLDRHPPEYTDLPAPFRTLCLSSINFFFVLVINGHKKEWLVDLQTALSQAMKPLIKTWALPVLSVAVLNHEMALQHGLLSRLVKS